ncbi:MAG: hypothetical protein JXM74_07075 [Fusobacteriaceae bacterium]|nr:hypothetical protein [Fusobacteriaceae bacterium]
MNFYLGDFITSGHNVYIDTKKRNIKYSEKDLKLAAIEIIVVIKKFIDEVYTEMVQEDIYKGVSEYPYVFAPFFSSITFDKMFDLILTTDISFAEAFNKSVTWFLNNEYFNNFNYILYDRKKEKLLKQTLNIKERAIKIVHRYFINKMANYTTKDIIISINKFEKEYFYELPQNVKGFVCRNIENELLLKDMAFAFEVPIAVTSKNFKNAKYIIIDNKNQKLFIDPNETVRMKSVEKQNKLTVDTTTLPKYNSNVIKYYASIVDRSQVDLVKANGWYLGGVFYRTEYIFLAKGNFPTYDELLDIYISVMNAFHDRVIHFQMPEFNYFKQIDYEVEEVHTEVDEVSLFQRIYYRTVNAIYEASKITGKQVTLVIPMLRMGKEVCDWKDKIDCFIGMDRSAEYGPKFGIVMETESSFEYFEDYRNVDSIIFGMDNFLEESLEMSRYDQVDEEYFMRAAWPDLHLTHQFYRKNGIRMLHMMAGQILRDPFYLRKFMNKGFKHFIIPLSNLKIAEEVLHQYESSRGKYAGVHAERKKVKNK